MNSSTPPIICSIALAAMAAAGMSHWWSVRQLMANPTLASSQTVLDQPTTLAVAKNATLPEPTPAVAPASDGNPIARQADADPSAREEFFQTLIGEIRELRNQNQDLRDQIAETNRDVMKLEFRVDTHSESFRPLPVSEDRFDTTFEADSGVLPPRALPADLPDDR